MGVYKSTDILGIGLMDFARGYRRVRMVGRQGAIFIAVLDLMTKPSSTY